MLAKNLKALPGKATPLPSLSAPLIALAALATLILSVRWSLRRSLEVETGLFFEVFKRLSTF